MEHTSLSEHFSAAFLRHSHKPAITFLRQGRPVTRLSFLELESYANRMANTFQSMGVAKGDRVILFMQKSLLGVTAHLALLKLGAVSVPLNPGFTQSEMAYLLKDAQPKLIVLNADTADFISAIDPRLTQLNLDSQTPFHDQEILQNASDKFVSTDIQESDPGVMIYTSGTTGNPKGVILTQKNLVADALNIIEFWQISESDILCHALPLFHVHGLCFALHTALMAGSHVRLLNMFAPKDVFDVLRQRSGGHVCTVFMAVPAMYAKLLQYIGERELDFGHLRLITSGSAPLLPKDFDRIRQVFGQEPVEREGMSETGMNFSNPLHGKRKPGSIGLPMPGVNVRMVDTETGIDISPGQTGEIWLQSPAITPGYWRKPEETARAFTDGWFKTGDLGHVDSDGYYYLTDRLKHIIISGGENIFPKEVEAVINQIQGVRESAAVGIPDEKWGERLVAAVVSKPGVSMKSDQIESHCKAHLHSWKCPKAVIFVSELPRNTMGKVLIEEVRNLFPKKVTKSQ